VEIVKEGIRRAIHQTVSVCKHVLMLPVTQTSITSLEALSLV